MCNRFGVHGAESRFLRWLSGWFFLKHDRTDFCGARKWSISDGLADCSDELAVLDATRFSRLFTVAGLADWNMSYMTIVAVVLLLQLAPSSSHIHVQADNHTHMSSNRSRYARGIVLCARYIYLITRVSMQYRELLHEWAWYFHKP